MQRFLVVASTAATLTAVLWSGFTNNSNGARARNPPLILSVATDSPHALISVG